MLVDTGFINNYFLKTPACVRTLAVLIDLLN